MKKVLILLLVLVMALGLFLSAYAAPNYKGGWFTNCPGDVITSLEGDGVMVHCIAYSKPCDGAVQIWNNGSIFINVLCDSPKP